MAVVVSCFVRVDRRLRRHDGRHAADGAPNSEQEVSLGGRPKIFPSMRHHAKRKHELDRNQHRLIPPMRRHRRRQIARRPGRCPASARARRSRCRDGRSQEWRKVRNDQAENDRPKHILDARESNDGGREGKYPRDSRSFPGNADREQQQRPGSSAEQLLRSRRLASGGGKRDGLGGQGRLSVLSRQFSKNRRLPADAMNDVQPDECGEGERDHDGGGVCVEGQLAGGGFHGELLCLVVKGRRLGSDARNPRC